MDEKSNRERVRDELENRRPADRAQDEEVRPVEGPGPVEPGLEPERDRHLERSVAGEKRRRLEREHDHQLEPEEDHKPGFDKGSRGDEDHELKRDRDDKRARERDHALEQEAEEEVEEAEDESGGTAAPA